MCPIHSFYPTYSTLRRMQWSRNLQQKQCMHAQMCHYMYLLRCAEDVSIILAEPSNTSETSQRSRELIAMQRPKVGPSHRKLPPRANTLLKHETKHKKEK